MPYVFERVVPVVLVSLVAMTLLSLAASPLRAQTPTSAPAAPKPSAEAYYQWLAGCLDAIEKDMPAITRSAETAAAAYIREGWEIGAWGDPGIVGEFNSRAGGLMRTSSPKAIEEPNWKGIALVFPHEENLNDDLDRAIDFEKHGCILISFLSKDGLRLSTSLPLDILVEIDAIAVRPGS